MALVALKLGPVGSAASPGSATFLPVPAPANNYQGIGRAVPPAVPIPHTLVSTSTLPVFGSKALIASTALSRAQNAAPVSGTSLPAQSATANSPATPAAGPLGSWRASPAQPAALAALYQRPNTRALLTATGYPTGGASAAGVTPLVFQPDAGPTFAPTDGSWRGSPPPAPGGAGGGYSTEGAPMPWLGGGASAPAGGFQVSPLMLIGAALVVVLLLKGGA